MKSDKYLETLRLLGNYGSSYSEILWQAEFGCNPYIGEQGIGINLIYIPLEEESLSCYSRNSAWHPGSLGNNSNCITFILLIEDVGGLESIAI